MSFHKAFNFFLELVHPVGFLFMIFFDVVAADLFSDKDELIVVVGSLAISEQLVLHHTDLLSLFLVSVGHLVFGDPGVSLRDDSDQKVQKNDNVEQASDKDHDPVTLPVVFNFISCATKSSETERLLPGDNIALQVLFVIWAIWVEWRCWLHFALEDHDLLDRKEGICESDHADCEHDQEGKHVKDTVHNHADEPAKLGNGSQIEEEAEPNCKSSPSLNRPEVGVFSIPEPDIGLDQEWRD